MCVCGDGGASVPQALSPSVLPSGAGGASLKRRGEKVGGGRALEVLLSLLEFLCLEVKVDHCMILPTLSPQISGLSDFKLSPQK